MGSLDSGIVGLRLKNLQRGAVSLPDELLCQIFESACHIVISTRSDPSSVILASTVRRTVQNAILATCTRWRHVALATTSLWESVLVTHPNDLAADESGRIPMMTGIERAGTRTLSLYVSGTLDTYNWDKTCTLLRPHVHRFRQIFVSQKFYPRDFGLLVDLSSHEAASPLRTLVLTWRQSKPREQENIDLTRATALRHLQLNITHWRGPFIKVQPPPSSELTHLRLSSKIDPSDAIRVIASTKSLQALRWSFKGDQTPSLDSIRSQPYLQNLSLAGALPTHLLAGLEAARLDTLQIDLLDASPPGVAHITTRAFPNLRSLHISGSFIVSWENSPHQAIVRSILSSCPQLERVFLPYTLDDHLVPILTSDSLPPNIRDVWVFVDDTVHRAARELLHTWSNQEGRKDIVLHIHSVTGREALVEAQARDLMPTYGERVTVGEAHSEYDRLWTVATCM